MAYRVASNFPSLNFNYLQTRILLNEVNLMPLVFRRATASEARRSFTHECVTLNEL